MALVIFSAVALRKATAVQLCFHALRSVAWKLLTQKLVLFLYFGALDAITEKPSKIHEHSVFIAIQIS